jgi:predicted nuclease of predicted toxin-antitoxin system
MKWLLDESAEYRIGQWLKAQGHDVTAIAQDYPHALPDSQVLEIAVKEQRVLITNDRDFGELIFREHLPHSGVIYFKLGLASTAEEKIRWLQHILVRYADKLHRFIVVTRRGVRVR